MEQTALRRQQAKSQKLRDDNRAFRARERDEWRAAREREDAARLKERDEIGSPTKTTDGCLSKTT